ncbi:FAD-binding oxidoreductase [Streptomyces sp. ISID311]|uniref:NAD(P)/FAD-dependent oxidoreductase n=1 Tax=Streptomyces sp. ISID311 TaxID=2601673 RepID=UPI0011BD3EF1|nr:FAD-binding oxidoreductase [Streptomyces sp. ISID311]TXC99733.1 FAD-binding oxidoreductase [Streptomyces sp. ISID311]
MPGQQNTTDMLIIGGGVTALSIAYHCARADIDVIMLDPDAAEAAVAPAARPVRTYQPGNVHNSELTVRSLADYRAFPPAGGADLVLSDVGWLVMPTDRQEAAELERELAVQRAAGVELEPLTPDQARAHNPWLDPAGAESAIWCPQSYLLDVDKVVRGYAAGAREHGARLLTGQAVTGMDAKSGRVATARGEFAAETVVLAAEAGSGELAASAGLELPLWAQSAELFRTDPILADGEFDAPFTVHPASGLKTLGAGRSFLVGLERISQQEGMRDAWFKETAEELATRYPKLKGVGLHSVWTGTVDVTPARTACIGRASGAHERLIVAAGYTGQDLGQAPATGRIIRDLHLGRSPGVDLTPFALTPSAQAAGGA